MQVIKEPLKGLLVIKPSVFSDKRGYFFESFNRQVFEQAGIPTEYVQDNESLSAEVGVLRGLHYQAPPHAQDKLIRVIRGRVLDIVVDIRKNSETYGRHFRIEMTSTDKEMLFVPKGFAHGFVTLEPNSIFSYKCSALYNKESEGTIMWNDPELDLDWGVENPILSDKDRKGRSFKDFSSPF